MQREFHPAAPAALSEDPAAHGAQAILAITRLPRPDAGSRGQDHRGAAAGRAATQGPLPSAHRGLRTPQLPAHPGVVDAYAAAVRSLVASCAGGTG
jgi:hypothetical protein